MAASAPCWSIRRVSRAHENRRRARFRSERRALVGYRDTGQCPVAPSLSRSRSGRSRTARGLARERLICPGDERAADRRRPSPAGPGRAAPVRHVDPKKIIACLNLLIIEPALESMASPSSVHLSIKKSAPCLVRASALWTLYGSVGQQLASACPCIRRNRHPSMCRHVQ